MSEDTGKELTGRMVLIIIVSAFAVIIGVNLFMAWMAIGTFPGLEGKNTFVASQNFNADRRAQEALGWDVSAAIDGEQLTLNIIGPEAGPVQVVRLDATLGRAASSTDDRLLAFTRSDSGAYVSQVGVLAPGKWDLRLTALAQDGTPFRQRIELYLRGN